MRETLVCTGRIGKSAYRFPETGIGIFSYEELCYYLSHHMICYLHTLPREDLLAYIRDELGLERLSKVLSKLQDPEKDQMKYFAALFREGTYYTEEEIRDILDRYRSLKNAPASAQYRMLGDLYLSCHRAGLAQKYYRRAIGLSDDKKLSGVVYHNLGVAQLRLFRFSDSRVSFLRAYQNAQEEASLFAYYAVIALTENLKEAEKELREFEVSDLVLSSFASRFAAFREEFSRQEEAARLRQIIYLKENGRPEDAQRKRARMVRRMQEAFRPQMETDENHLMAKPPALQSINKKKNQEEKE